MNICFTGQGSMLKYKSVETAPPTIFCDDNICVGAAILVYMVHSLLHTVHHLHTAL